MKKRFLNLLAKEDAPANAAGDGNIAGIGVGDKGEPGVPVNNKYKKKNIIINNMLKR